MDSLQGLIGRLGERISQVIAMQHQLGGKAGSADVHRVPVHLPIDGVGRGFVRADGIDTAALQRQQTSRENRENVSHEFGLVCLISGKRAATWRSSSMSIWCDLGFRIQS